MKRKAISSLLCALAIIQMSVTPAYATNITQQTSTPGNQSATITYDQGSKFTVTIPKTIALDKTTTHTYNVKVEGDISADEAVTVTPDATVAMTDTNSKNSVTGTITQEKTKFVATEVNQVDGTTTTGNISAPDLKAGNWSGQFNFYINVDANNSGNDNPVTQEAGLYDADGKLLCTWEDSGINIEKDYIAATKDPNSYATSKTSAYYVLNNTYPTATKIVIPESVTKLGNSAFYECGQNLTEVVIPNTVTSIGNLAFGSCYKLTKVNIPNGVTTLGVNTFSNCHSLTSISIPEGLESIPYGTFNRCLKLTDVKLPDTLKEIGNTAFCDCPELINITIPNEVTTIGDGAFKKCTGLTDIELPESVTTIGIMAFEECTGLSTIVLPDGIATISRSTFDGCTSLESINIPNSVISIEHSAFSDCKSLKNITIPENVKNIGYFAFFNCNKLTSAIFKTTTGWYVSTTEGKRETLLSSSDLANPVTAVKYLNSSHYNKYWIR